MIRKKKYFNWQHEYPVKDKNWAVPERQRQPEQRWLSRHRSDDALADDD